MSGVVRDAFAACGWDAWSCDLLPSITPGQHIIGDVRERLNDGWDMMIAFPPCTHLCVSGARWFWKRRKQKAQELAIDFFLDIACAPIAKTCIENPVGIMSTIYEPPTQIIQPWQFGHGETKATCLWLFGLPKLVPTNIVAGREARIHNMPPSKDRGLLRSLTYSGIATAMADQWGKA